MDGIQRKGTSLIPDGSMKDSNTYARGGSGEDHIDTEGGGEEDGFDTEDGNQEDGLIQRVVVG